MVSRGVEVRILAACELWWQVPELSKLSVPSPETIRSYNSVTDKLYSDELKSPSKLILTFPNNSNILLICLIVPIIFINQLDTTLFI